MSGKNSVRDRLHQIIAEKSIVDDGWRRIGVGTGTCPLADLIAEIDTTLFPRLLAFRNRQGEVIYLEAANRRARRFVPPIPEKLLPYAQLFEGEFLEPEPEMFGRISSMLQMHFAGSPYIQVRATQLAAGNGSAQTGVSAIRLSKAWSESQPRRSDCNKVASLEELQAILSRNCSTWVMLNNGHPEAGSSHGFDAEVVDKLTKVDWQDLLRNPEIGPSTRGAPTCCIMASSSDPAAVIVLAANGNRSIIARTTSQCASEISELWLSQVGLSQTSETAG